MIDAKEYAKALFLLTEEERTTSTVADQLQTVKRILSENPKYIQLLDTPALAKEEKLILIDGAFSSLNGNLLNLIKILCEKHAVYQFSRMADGYAALYDESRGIERVEAVTAVVMQKQQLDALTKKLELMTGKTVIVRNTVDPSILGGVILRYAGTQLDGSIRARLEGFAKALKEMVIE